MSKNNKNGNPKKRFPKTALISGILIAAIVIGLAVYALQLRDSATSEVEETPETEVSMKPHLEGAQNFAAKPTSTPKEEHDEKKEKDSTEPEENGVSTDDLISYLPVDDSFPSEGGITPGGSNYENYITPEPIPTISFPYEITDKNLIVQQISPYSGYFLEDGSDNSVDNIAAIVLTNNGEALDFVGIGIAQGENSYAFSGSKIPGHSTVIIQEQTGSAMPDGDFHSCTATVTDSTGMQTTSDLVLVTDNGNNTFTVSNISDKTIPEVTVYFKNYLPDEDVYVGGITYHMTLEDIEPGTGIEVNSGHYASGYSVIVDLDITE